MEDVWTPKDRVNVPQLGVVLIPQKPHAILILYLSPHKIAENNRAIHEDVFFALL
jgi:hypothetical protein